MYLAGTRCSFLSCSCLSCSGKRRAGHAEGRDHDLVSMLLLLLQEELSAALFHIKDVASRQREVQRRVELLQAEGAKELVSVPRR